MYLARSSCVICGEHISKLQYNLKTTFTEKSNVLLIKLIEKFYKNILFLHCNICTACYNVINELDTIQQRQKELFTQLKNNIARIDKSNLDKSVLSENDDDFCFDYTDSASDSAHCSSLSKISTITGKQLKKEDSFEEEIKVDDIDFKKLPITIKRVKPEINETSMNDLETSVETSKKSKKEVDENNKLFEKIQSSIKRELSNRMIEQTNKEKPSKDYLCEICGISFRSQTGYLNHIKKHDDIEDEMKLLALNKLNDMWLCNVCGKGFQHKAALKRHLPIHTGMSRFQCEQCGKDFFHQSSFRMHQKIHANKRDAICDICKHAFLTRSHLKRHLRTAHEKAVKSHTCEICQRKFLEQYNLNAHLKSHQPKINVLSVEEPLKNNPVEPAEPMENENVLENTETVNVVENTDNAIVENSNLTIYDMQTVLGNDQGLLKIHEPSTGLTYTITCSNLF